MINDQHEYEVTKERALQFAVLIHRMKTGEAKAIPGEAKWIRQAKLESAESVLQDLQDEIAEWEAAHPSKTTATAVPELP